MRIPRSWLLPLSLLVGACNMVISETPMFSEGDRGSIFPKDGVWVGDDPECEFDASVPEPDWPQCALWVVVRDSGAELLMNDGKGQSQRVGALFASGNPQIVQGEWFDDAKEPVKAYYSFFALEPRDIDSESRFSSALVWPIECGVQDEPNGDIRPFPGITPECRPASREAIRSAATASRRAEQIKEWRWLRDEAR